MTAIISREEVDPNFQRVWIEGKLVALLFCWGSRWWANGDHEHQFPSPEAALDHWLAMIQQPPVYSGEGS
jgi:hypothetical protein